MERYRINFSNHINSGWLILLIIAISIIIPYLMFIIKDGELTSYIDGGIFIFCLFALPAIIIHINYYFVNYGNIFQYYHEERKITIVHKGKSTTFNLDDIDCVRRSMSFNLAAKRSFITAWEGYNHSYICLKNGQRFTITSLLVPYLDLPLEEGKVIIKENFYRLAKAY